MDDKLNQTGENPVSGTDPAQNPGSTEAPTAAAPQGEGATSAQDPTVDTSPGPQGIQDEPAADETPAQSEPQPDAQADTQPDTQASDQATEHHANQKQNVSEGGPNLGNVVAGVAAMGLAAVFGAARGGNKDAPRETGGSSEADGSGETDADVSAANADEHDMSAAPEAASQEQDSIPATEARDMDQDEASAQDMGAQDMGRNDDAQGGAAQDSAQNSAPQSTSQTETSDGDAQTDSQGSTPQTEPEEDDGSSMTMEEVMAASDEQLARKPIHRGMLTTGTVILLSQEGLVIDVGQKVEGLVPYNQLFEFETTPEEAAKYFKSGDELQVYAIRVDIANSTIILSKKRADQERAWNLLQDIFDKKLPVEVEIVEKVRGGLVANLGVRAFLPASQVDVRRINELEPYVGKRMRVRIIELNRRRNRVIISRRSIMEEELAGQKEETLKQLEPGAKLEGEVVEITDFGAFVNLGGVDGLVHRSEITHGRFNHPREVLEVGQKVQVEVLDMDLERERINLSMKSLKGDPWENVLGTFHIGQKVSGKVTNITPFGAFVEIESGLEGLIHVSEMSWTKRVRHPKEVVEEGQEVEAMVLKIDVPQQRISLGLRQTQPDPWSSLPDRYPPGTEITGPITGLTDFGVFMEIEEGVEGLVHISELAHEHIDDVSEHFNKGDEITAVILNIDPIEQRASLSRKRTLPFSAGSGEGGYEGGAPLGAPQSRGGARKGGRRGGRRSQGIDYDYSYASADAGSRTTTKLGDVYADLFAQFGLNDNAPSAASDDNDAATEASADDVAVAPADTGSAQAESGSAETAGTTPETSTADETAAPQQTSAPAPEKKEQEPEVEPENAIDAAEAAALLTAAFRQGKRPAPATLEPELKSEAQAETPEDSAEETTQEEEKETTDA